MNYKMIIALAVLPLLLFSSINAIASDSQFRPPSVLLFSCDPYFSLWSSADTLTETTTTHWTNKPYPLTSLIRIDGKTYRLMSTQPQGLPALEQVALNVLPTKTVYKFCGQGVSVQLTFLQPALPDDIDLMSRPICYLTWECSSVDGRSHDVAIYLDAGMELVVNEPQQQVVWSKETISGMQTLKAGTKDQHILWRKGDDVRIDWGYFYMTASKMQEAITAVASAEKSRMSFAGQGKLLSDLDNNMPRRVCDNSPVMAMQFSLDNVSSHPKTCQAILAYDDIYSILYFRQQLKAFWKKDGKTIQDIITEAANDYQSLVKRCDQFDQSLMQDLYQAGGSDYQKIGALAYRQALGANKIVVGKSGMPLMFSKENFSNGCMATVDVFYPFSPQVLLFNPTLAKASFVPILEYSRSERWNKPFAPHDVGTYPHAMGQTYGGDMAVEESGNMILLIGAVVQAENDIDFARQYWDVISGWAEYLKDKGLVPGNELCTDDFAGHLANNVNLSVKAILALGAYAQMADMMGEKSTAVSYRQAAEGYVKKWMRLADDGDHYKLAFDREGTWSQKYNLVWDRVLNLNLFPTSVAQKEMAYYKKIQNQYGLPLDNRSDYTKLDWILWTASITGDKNDFKALIAPVVKFLNNTPDRVPMTDWYWTSTSRQRGFQARPVVGGVFIRLMDDPKVWNKWAGNADTIKGSWSPLPKAPKVTEVVPTSRQTAHTWCYTFDKPNDEWFNPQFNPIANGWKEGPGGFGTIGTPNSQIGTIWDTSDIWIRREFDFSGDVSPNLQLLVHHDEDAEVYINGVLAARLQSYTANYEPFILSKQAMSALKPGKNLIAIHCHQTDGGQYIDAGFAEVIEQY